MATLLLAACGGGGSGSQNTPPVANAGPDQNAAVNTTVTLDGSGSSDSDGTIAQYLWTQIVNPGDPTVTLSDSSAVSPTFTAPSVQNQVSLVFELQVTDNDGATDTDQVTITVTNTAPTADAGADQTVDSSDPVTLDGSASTDSDGSITQYTWRQVISAGDPVVTINNANTATATFTAPVVNTQRGLVFELEVTDDGGATDTDQVTVTVNAAAPLLSDDFNDGDSNGWANVDDSGETSTWIVVNGVLEQQARVEAKPGAFDKSYHKGTFMYYTAGNAWQDYIFDVDVTYLDPVEYPLAEDIGIMFRYQDANNYYRFSMNSRYGFSRLEKKVGGTFTTLAVNARGYPAIGQTLHIKIVTKGNAHLVYLDGEPLFAAEDSGIASGTVALYTQEHANFDNVVVNPVGDEPRVILAAPTAFSIDTDTTLDALAIALNVPAGGGVDFVLDGVTTQSDTNPPFTATFNTSAGDHVIETVLKASDGTAVSTDTNTTIGAGGDAYLAIGDSLILGEQDNFAGDNVSQSQRVLGFQGIEAPLTDAFDSKTISIVLNEGLGGHTSGEVAQAIDSILERQPNANQALILLGTNDSAPFGGGPVSRADFTTNMQAMITALQGKGITPYVAKIPPAWRDTGGSAISNDPWNLARNVIIRDYNDAIENDLTGINPGPDLFSAFLENGGINLISLFSDSYLHFNALGMNYKAALFHNAVYPANPIPLPFILKNLQPSTSAPWLKQNLLEEGDYYYMRRSGTNAEQGTPDPTKKLASIPAYMKSGVWVMTAEEDDSDTSANYASFEVDRAVTVYVAYAQGATLPTWLSTWQATGDQVTVSGDPDTTTFDVYQKGFNANDTVTLGGNNEGPGDAPSNYLVSVVPN
ncbi:MAG TPA: DUF1080 domain-containing protein [Chromatiales bacterium]|nr:DUF1080 domain-containing protein [Chromatiales bacterium]